MYLGRNFETSANAERVNKSVPAVRRAAAILWLLAKRLSPMNLSQISRATEILPSTALHILRELAETGLVAHDTDSKTYRLGPGIMELAQAVIKHDNFADLARPYLQRIAWKYGSTATATVQVDANHMACVACVNSPGAMSLNVTLGGRVPLMSGAAGRCVAAFGNYPMSSLRQGFSQVDWSVDLTFKQWIRQVEKTRLSGYGEDVGFFSLGVTTLAVPVYSPDGSMLRVIGTVSITEQLAEGRKLEIVSELKEAASEIKKQFSG